MTDVENWSQVDGNNDDLLMEEGMARTSVNNDSRDIMGAVRTYVENAQWLNLFVENDAAFTFAIGASPDFLITDGTGTDATTPDTKVQVGRWLKLTGAGPTSPIYGEISAAVYSDPNTTVTLINIKDSNWATTTLTLTSITSVECFVSALVREAAFHPVGATLAQAPQQLPTIDDLGDGATKDEGAGGGLDGGLLDGLEGDQYQLTGISSRNWLTNGSMEVWQRNTIFPESTLTDTDFTADQWHFLSEGTAGWAISQTSKASASANAPDGFTHALEMTAEVTDQQAGIMQIISNDDSIVIVDNGVASLSYYVLLPAGSGIANVRAAILSWTGAIDAPTHDWITAWNAEGTDPSPAASWAVQNTPVDDEHTPVASWTRIKIENVTISSSTKNLAVFIWADSTTHTTLDFFRVTGIHLEPGSSASGYQHRKFSDDMLQCLPYFQKTYEYEVSVGGKTFRNSIRSPVTPTVADVDANNAIVDWRFTSSMFNTPTVTPFSGQTGESDKAAFGQTDVACDVVGAGTNGVTLRVTDALSGTDELDFHAIAVSMIGS